MSTTTGSVVEQQVYTALEQLPWWATATDVERAALAADMDAVCGGTGLPVPEYLESMADFASAAEYLAECGQVPEGDSEPESAPESLPEDKPLDAIVRAFCRGEAAYRKHLLDCGRLCLGYVNRRVKRRGDSKPRDARAAAVKAIEGRLAEVATDATSTDPNLLIACYAVSVHLGEGVDFTGMPWGTLREFRPLVERYTVAESGDAAEEGWRVLESVGQDKARALFLAACTLDSDGERPQRSWVVGEVRKLLGKPPVKAAQDTDDETDADSQGEQAKAPAGPGTSNGKPAGAVVSTESVAEPKPLTNLQHADPVDPREVLATSLEQATPKDAAELLFGLLWDHCEDAEAVYAAMGELLREQLAAGKPAVAHSRNGTPASVAA